MSFHVKGRVFNVSHITQVWARGRTLCICTTSRRMAYRFRFLSARDAAGFVVSIRNAMDDVAPGVTYS
jgi:hypothetical protein